MTPLRLYVPTDRVVEALSHRWRFVVGLAEREGWTDEPKPGHVELVAVAAIRNPTEQAAGRTPTESH